MKYQRQFGIYGISLVVHVLFISHFLMTELTGQQAQDIITNLTFQGGRNFPCPRFC